MCFKVTEKLIESILEYDEKEWPTTVDDEEKYFATNENIEADDQSMEESDSSKGIDQLEKSSNTFNKDLFLDLLVLTYPSLKEELFYCAPELIWYKIKVLTGIDIENVIKIYEEYNKDINCENCSENKQILKRKFIETIYHDNNKRQC